MSSEQVHLLLSVLFVVSTVLSPSASAIGYSTLTPIQPLADGRTLISANRTFELGFFSPANSTNRYVGIWYHNISVKTVVWVANRKRPVFDRRGNLSMTANGTLLVTNDDSTIVWSSELPQALANPEAQLLDSGNFIVKDLDSRSIGDDVDPDGFAWQSFDHPTDTLLPGQKLGWNLRTSLDRKLTSWVNASDPAPGEFAAGMDMNGYPQLIVWRGSRVLFRAGPWNGKIFSGLRQQEKFSMFLYEFVYNSDEVYVRFWIVDPNVIYRSWMEDTGAAQGLIWMPQNGTWNTFTWAQSDLCDALSTCGPNGVCDTNTWPICNCPTGFEPKSPTSWALRDNSAGCVRRTALDCTNGTDGFITVGQAKLPDTSSAWADLTLSLEQCRERCLTNCSCAAYAGANVSSGIGCIFWGTAAGLVDVRLFAGSGQDLFIRMAAKDLAIASTSYKSSKKRLIIVTAVCFAVGISAFVLVAFFLRRKFPRIIQDQPIGESRDLELPLFDFDTISTATDNFSYENQLGRGGFGFVYKGKLKEGQEIAVKRLSKTSIQGVDEFKNEVTLIAKLQHRNLVRLLGCCIARDERLLVYEYMPNKSLDNFLFDKHEGNGMHLKWEARYSIIEGIARGLVYLHQDSRLRIIHRDLKASNILLDRDLNPKISDFGLARIFGGDDAKIRTGKVVGTYGYMSPEYAMDGYFSVKSDVFSFGVLILEIISGQRNRGVYLSEPQTHLLGNAWNLWNEGKSMELLDATINGDFVRDEVLRCIKIGLLCVQEFPNDRPTMSAVVMMLGRDHVALPQPKQPGFVARRGISEPQSSREKQELQSANDLTITLTMGR